MKNDKLKVLMELRPCFEGFAGIPQETRLIFCAFNKMEEVEVSGLINHAARYLKSRLLKKKGKKTYVLSEFHRLHNSSRLALSTKADPLETRLERWLRVVDRYLGGRWLEFGSAFGRRIKIRPFDATDFGDFVWQTLFSKSLPASDYETIAMAHLVSMHPPWNILNKIAAKPMRTTTFVPPPRLDTRNYDVFISQTPWPTQLHNRTQLVVRYHDAIPVFLPHTIPHAAEHQMSHMAGLRLSQQRGVFACTSEATRTELLKLVPHCEKRAVVIPDIVSQEYYVEVGDPNYVTSIIRNNIDPDTEPEFLTKREKERFYAASLQVKPLRFLIMVSTLEPRKNHMKLIGAWDYLVNHGMPDLKLVLVGTLGWDNDNITRAMAPQQEQGRLFHLQGVPSGQLRVLYNAARAVVCPSVCEGFDLSGIEAMLCGGAVVSSDIPVHREVYGDACEYFNPYSVISQAKAIQNVIDPNQPGRRDELIDKALKFAPRYRGDSIAPQWRDLFERIGAGEFAKIV